MVSFIERDQAVNVVSFCSNHILGTALPPPSVGGLRPNSPVTCGFSTSHPALSRRPRAVGAGTFGSLGRARARAKARGRNLPPFRGCSVRAGAHLLSSPPGMLRQAFGRDRIPPSRPRWRRLTLALLLQALGLRRREPSGRACPPSSPSSPPMRCPGSGLQRSRRLLVSKPLRPPWRSRVAAASPHAAGGDDPASAATGIPAGESRAETWPSPPLQRHPRGSSRVGEEGRVNEELSGGAGQGGCVSLISSRQAGVRRLAPARSDGR